MALPRGSSLDNALTFTLKNGKITVQIIPNSEDAEVVIKIPSLA